MRTGTHQGVSDNEGAGGGWYPESMLQVPGKGSRRKWAPGKTWS